MSIADKQIFLRELKERLGVFSSPAALRKAALQEFDVIIRDDLFPKEDETE